VGGMGGQWRGEELVATNASTLYPLDQHIRVSRDMVKGKRLKRLVQLDVTYPRAPHVLLGLTLALTLTSLTLERPMSC